MHAQAHTSNPSKLLQSEPELPIKPQQCNNPPVLKYLWPGAYNPLPFLYYLSPEMIQPLEVHYIDTRIQKITGALLSTVYCSVSAATNSVNEVNKNLQIP